MSNSSGILNGMIKIDLNTHIIADSTVLTRRGAFTAKAPVIAPYGNQQFLITSIVDGIPAKNSTIREDMYSYYYVVNAHNLNIIAEDSLVGAMIAEVKEFSSDTISIEWVGGHNDGWHRSLYRVDPPARRLRHVESHEYSESDFGDLRIGNYLGPNLIARIGPYEYYWGYEDVGDTSYVNIFNVNPQENVEQQVRIGNRTVQNVVVGYSSETNMLYIFLTPFKMLSYAPINESPNYIGPEIIVMNTANFDIEERASFEMGAAYASQECGTAESIGSYLYYYYFRQDGYGSFDPAWLLIFDTRTNETTWLRVGWR